MTVEADYHIMPTIPGWKISFNLALVLHILILSSAILLPKVLHRKPAFPEVYSVDLINIAVPSSPTAAPPPAQATPAAATQKPKVVKARKTAPIAEAIDDPVPAAPVAAVSLKPLKRKIKKKIPADTRARDERRRKAAELQRRQHLAEAKRQQAIADAEAKLAANEAVNALKRSLRADAVATSTKQGQGTTVRRGNGAASSLEAQYFSSIFSHLHQYWSLPEIKTWDRGISAVVVITIGRNGQILKHHFEKHSGDKVYDRFVSRTIEDANPLPAIPAALKKQEITIGLVFKPGGIQ